MLRPQEQRASSSPPSVPLPDLDLASTSLLITPVDFAFLELRLETSVVDLDLIRVAEEWSRLVSLPTDHEGRRRRRFRWIARQRPARPMRREPWRVSIVISTGSLPPDRLEAGRRDRWIHVETGGPATPRVDTLGRTAPSTRGSVSTHRRRHDGPEPFLLRRASEDTIFYSLRYALSYLDYSALKRPAFRAEGKVGRREE